MKIKFFKKKMRARIKNIAGNFSNKKFYKEEKKRQNYLTNLSSNRYCNASNINFIKIYKKFRDKKKEYEYDFVFN